MDIRKLLVEFLGTFALVFVGTMAVAATGIPAGGANVVVPAMAHGLIIVGLVFAFGGISGGHFNPAVTTAMLVGRKIDPVSGAAYIVVQFLGGLVGAIFMNLLLPDRFNFGVTKGILTDTNVLQASGIEFVMVFIFITVIFQTAAIGRAGNLAPLAIGLTLAALIAAGGMFTGASYNPARTLGPAILAGDLSYVIPYLVALFAGGALAGFVNSTILGESVKS